MLQKIQIRVPQDSVLDPLFFYYVYINDLAKCSNLSTTLYADDNVLTMGHKNVKKLQNQINKEQARMTLAENISSIDIAKSHYLLFTNRYTYTEFNIFIGNQRLTKQDTTRYFGSIF